MPKDFLYLHLLAQCQSPDLGHRLDALEDLRQHEYLDLVEGQFLLDRLNSTAHWQEQAAILRLMCEIEKPLPTEALMTILEDAETSSPFLRAHVANTLAVVRAEDAIDLVLRLIADPHEEVYLREELIGDLTLWGERIPRGFLLTLLDDPELCAAALDMWRSHPSQSIPLERILPYCAHEEKYLREAAIKALLAAERLCPPDPILAALGDPEPEVRTAASYGCISLAEWFGDQIPAEPLLAALYDEYPPVRENILDALGKVPLRIPVEPVAAALTDVTYYVRCAALETIGLMGERVPSSLFPLLQELSGSDPAPQVRLRATRALLLLHGMTPAPLKIPIIDLTLESLDEELGE
jgi:HEAT repeat protein